MLSAMDFSLNALFAFSVFLIWDMKVHGSFIIGIFCSMRSSETKTILEIEYTPNDPPVLLHGLSGNRPPSPSSCKWQSKRHKLEATRHKLYITGNEPPKRINVGVEAAFEDILVHCSTRGNAEVLRIQTATWVVLKCFIG